MRLRKSERKYKTVRKGKKESVRGEAREGKEREKGEREKGERERREREREKMLMCENRSEENGMSGM